MPQLMAEYSAPTPKDVTKKRTKPLRLVKPSTPATEPAIQAVAARRTSARQLTLLRPDLKIELIQRIDSLLLT